MQSVSAFGHFILIHFDKFFWGTCLHFPSKEKRTWQNVFDGVTINFVAYVFFCLDDQMKINNALAIRVRHFSVFFLLDVYSRNIRHLYEYTSRCTLIFI